MTSEIREWLYREQNATSAEIYRLQRRLDDLKFAHTRLMAWSASAIAAQRDRNGEADYERAKVAYREIAREIGFPEIAPHPEHF